MNLIGTAMKLTKQVINTFALLLWQRIKPLSSVFLPSIHFYDVYRLVFIPSLCSIR